MQHRVALNDAAATNLEPQPARQHSDAFTTHTHGRDSGLIGVHAIQHQLLPLLLLLLLLTNAKRNRARDPLT